jgi:biopolymer transport protein ExbB
MTLLLAPSLVLAQESSGRQHMNLLEMTKAGGWVGALIILASLIAVALIIEHAITLRRASLLPGHFVTQFEQHLKAQRLQEARQLCQSDGSLLAQILGAGLAQAGSVLGFFDMQTAMQEVSERAVGRLYRKLEYLSFIAVTAPMLGLLGTVTGMIGSFNVIAATEGSAKPSQLAGGISEALVTTCMGLIVAIPVTFFVSFYRNRIDSVMAEAETLVDRLMGRFRRPTGG